MIWHENRMIPIPGTNLYIYDNLFLFGGDYL